MRATAFIVLTIIGVISLCVGLSSCRSGVEHTDISSPAPPGSSSSESLRKTSASFKEKAHTGARLEEGEILFKQLQPGMSRQEVRQLLGEPDVKHSTSNYWFYTIWWSRYIDIRFEADRVVEITGG